MTTLPLPPNTKYLLSHHTHCDRYDYLIASACGAIGGIADIFLVNLPKTAASARSPTLPQTSLL